MHPTRTTTTLLLGVACAVSAVSGCANVPPAPMQPAAAPSAGVPPQRGPGRGPGAPPVVVQAPALEALKAVPGGSAGPAASTAAPVPAPRAAPDPAAGPEAPAPPVPDILAPVPDIPEPPVPDIPEPPKPSGRSAGRPGHGGGPGSRPHPVRPDAEVPREVAGERPVRPADVCALSRRHGRWHPDSPEARICAGAEDS